MVKSGKYTYRSFVRKVINEEDVVDIGNEYLRDLDEYCEISQIEGIHDYGVLNYKLIREGREK